MPKKKKLQDLTEANGKSLEKEAKAAAEKEAAPEGSPQKRKATTLAELFGEPNSRYAETDYAAYRSGLEVMNKVELQHECTRVGKIPKDSRERMIDILLKDFAEYTQSRTKLNRQPKNLEMSKKMKDLLRSGAFV